MKPTVTLALDVETPVERLSDRIEERASIITALYRNIQI
ncbi:hypothetical protein L915_02275 [Phytophthora nicotianae]|nr:hypothetical protein L915_02275 [Phytophthora nicotianae]